MRACYFMLMGTVFLCGQLSAADTDHKTKPNIIIILSDDHGYTDLGIHGIDANVQTPALDQLAAQGALMKNGYSTAPQCVPSRAGLMSGRVQNTFGLRGNGDSDEPIPLDVLTIAERLKKIGGYRTGFVGKWHLGKGQNGPENRGFDDYVDGVFHNYNANFNLDGQAIPRKSYSITTNRVLHQGQAAAAFIEKNHSQPFFLYLALYGPHLPRIEKDDQYFLNFPELAYPGSTPELDTIRRQGLALVKAVDDAVAGVVKKLRDHGLEENTILFFAGDNGAQPKYFASVKGDETLKKWDGSENVPLRGEKGSLWEGGMKVPMLVHWKNHIPAAQVITSSISTLDFTATTLRLAGGEIPLEFDGVDILPLLTKQTTELIRTKELFWDWGDGIALQKNEWKIHRYGTHVSLFNIKEDPNEFYDLKKKFPEKFKEMETILMARYHSLPANGKAKLTGKDLDVYVTGAPNTNPVDRRFLYPYQEGSPVAYPVPLKQ